MTITPTIIEDTPEYTITQIVDDVLKRTTRQVVYKTGTPQFNLAQLQQRAVTAITDCNTAETLLNANGWDGLSPAQRKAIALGLVQDVRAIIRVTMNLLDSPT